jgi:hypothetical protein
LGERCRPPAKHPITHSCLYRRLEAAGGNHGERQTEERKEAKKERNISRSNEEEEEEEEEGQDAEVQSENVDILNFQFAYISFLKMCLM